MIGSLLAGFNKCHFVVADADITLQFLRLAFDCNTLYIRTALYTTILAAYYHK